MKPSHITRNPGGEAKEKIEGFLMPYSGGGSAMMLVVSEASLYP
jgi:hypothetical protein